MLGVVLPVKGQLDRLRQCLVDQLPKETRLVSDFALKTQEQEHRND